MNRSFALGLLLSLAVFAPIGAHAALSQGDALSISPFQDFRTLETDHFRITYGQELEPIAQKTAGYLEAAHAVLSKWLRWESANKVSVLLDDQSDAENGLTAAELRFGMIFYLTPPDTFFSTDTYDDWLKILVIHEYTHFLNMDPTRGLYSFFRYVFGDSILPNSFWAPWMLEGLAVYDETRFTKSGRGRSPYYEMILRRAVEDGVLDTSKWMTLDQITSYDPKYPDGENIYLFGYQLLNQVEKGKASTLSEMTERSSSRVPYFINGNLENIADRDFYAVWDAWVRETRERMEAQLKTIRSQPVTPVKELGGTERDAIGIAVSPDGGALAYSMGTDDRWQELHLRNLRTGEDRALEDQTLGASKAFTADGRYLLYSTLHRVRNYRTYSDLKIYDLARNRSTFLTHGFRAKDPALSADGKWIAFTATDKGVPSLWIAKVRATSDGPRLESPRRAYAGETYDRIAQPQFSPDGRRIVFSFKKNGEPGEQIRAYRIDSFAGPKAGPATAVVDTLVPSDAHNRFPTFDPKGGLYYVSDRTGVDNLYRLDSYAAGARSVQATNVTSGLWLPTFARDGRLFASYFRNSGFAIAEVKLDGAPSGGYPSAQLKVSPPPAPAPEDYLASPASAESAAGTAPKFASKPYSVFPSIWPRAWSPILLMDDTGTYVGGTVVGFDATMRHEYYALGAYDSGTKKADANVHYLNRVWGLNVAIDLGIGTKDFNQYLSPSGGDLDEYTREQYAALTLSYPVFFTYSRLIPALSFEWDRDTFYQRLDGAESEIGKGRYVPEQSATLTFDDTRSSDYSIAPERGRRIFAGAKRYHDPDRDSYKGQLKWSEYLNLGGHFVLNPWARGQLTSRLNPYDPDANTSLTGRSKSVLNPFGGDSFEDLKIRGYPSRTFRTRRPVYTLASELYAPVAQIFRGWGTNPLFFNQLYLNAFAEDTFISGSPTAPQLPSYGFGAKFRLTAFHLIPLTIGIDWQKGTKESLGGKSEVVFGIYAPANLISF